MSGGFVPIPDEALDATDPSEWHAVVDIFKRGRALRWQEYTVTERALTDRWKMSNRRVWSLFEELAKRGLLSFERGTFRTPTRVTVFCPTAELHNAEQARAELLKKQQQDVRHSMQHSEQQNEDVSSGRIAELAALIAAGRAAQDAAILARHETETEKEPRRQPSLSLVPPPSDRVLKLEPTAPPKAQPTPRARKESKGPSGAWMRALTDCWTAEWNADERGGYPWQLKGADRTRFRQIAEACGIRETELPTPGQIADLRGAIHAYLDASDRGEAWPKGPPTTSNFLRNIPEWIQMGRAPRERPAAVAGAAPSVPPMGPMKARTPPSRPGAK